MELHTRRTEANGFDGNARLGLGSRLSAHYHDGRMMVSTRRHFGR
jgi:hypothetical protein